MFDLAIKGRKIIFPEGLKSGMVFIKGGIIADVAPYNTPYEGSVMELENSILIPGIIDPHVHINEPGRTDWEGFDTATKSAIAGGVSTLADMPLNASPVTTTVKAFREKLAAASYNLHSHCGFWGGVVPGNEKEIQGLIETGVLGFKAFLTHSGIDEFPNVTEIDLRKVLPVIAAAGLPLLVHCELTNATEGLKTINEKSYNEYLHSRPAKWEDNAIALVIRLCEEFNCRTHIVHLSSANSLQQIEKAKTKGLPVTVETAQHYLFFSAENIKDGATQFKCAPPIRERVNNDLLWEGLLAGTIDFVATDHSPAPPDLKHMETGSFVKAWGGIASLQFAFPSLWTAAKRKNIPLEKVVEWLTAKPALLIGQGHKKGKIKKGYDADLAVINSDKKFTVTPESIYHKHKITPYLGEPLYGITERTYLSGKEVFNAGTFQLLDTGKIITLGK